MTNQPDTFRFLPGEHILHIIGGPGPDTDDCEVLSDDGGEKVSIRFKVYGKGPYLERLVPRSALMWMRGSATSLRHQDYLSRNNA